MSFYVSDTLKERVGEDELLSGKYKNNEQNISMCIYLQLLLNSDDIIFFEIDELIFNNDKIACKAICNDYDMMGLFFNLNLIDEFRICYNKSLVENNQSIIFSSNDYKKVKVKKVSNSFSRQCHFVTIIIDKE